VTRHLHLAPAPPRRIESLAPAIIDLSQAPIRPGQIGLPVDITLNKTAAADVRRAAYEAGLPDGLWLAITIESDRALAEASEILNMERDQLAARLDTEASLPFERDVDAAAARALRAYARAINDGGAADAAAVTGELMLLISTELATSWGRTASAAGVGVADWVSHQARFLARGRHRWEAAAAHEGRSLIEWVFVQAARRTHSRNAAAHSRA
jgi:hypothetical protein